MDAKTPCPQVRAAIMDRLRRVFVFARVRGALIGRSEIVRDPVSVMTADPFSLVQQPLRPPERARQICAAAALLVGFFVLSCAQAQTIGIEGNDPLLARPLFAPDRRPTDAPTAPVLNHDPVLTGIVLRQDERRALFAPMISGMPAPALSSGDLIAEWRVTSIDADTVTLEKNGQVLSLHPHFGPAAPDDGKPVVASPHPGPAADRKQTGPRRSLVQH